MPFGDEFVWGTATAAYQIEGGVAEDGRGESIWDRFSHTPGNVAGGDTGDIACDSYHRWAEDLALLEGLGATGYRFSVAWPRVFPSGSGSSNPAGLDYYESLVDGLLNAGIRPFITLYHWDLPQGLQERGGWGSRDTAFYFADYADRVVSRLGDRCHDWITLNEPWVAAHVGHEQGRHAPGQRSLATALQAAHHLLLAHGLAVPRIRDVAADSRVGITLNLSPVHAATASSADEDAAARADGYYNRWYLEPLFRGAYPPDMWESYGESGDDSTGGGRQLALALERDPPPGACPFMEEDDLERIAAQLDFLGVNYYFRTVVEAGDGHATLGFSQCAAREGEQAGPATAMGWEVYPDGLGELLLRVHGDYGPLPLYVTENGAAFDDAANDSDFVDDADRIGFLRDHLQVLQEARSSGADVRGYFAWSLLDNFEWAYGYAKRFGLVRVDFGSLQRTPKASYRWYQRCIASDGAELDR